MAKYTPVAGNPFEGMVDEVPKSPVPTTQPKPKPAATASAFTPMPKGFHPFEGQDPNRTPAEIAEANLKKSVDNIMGGQLSPLPMRYGEYGAATMDAAYKRAMATEQERLIGIGRGLNRLAQGAKQVYLEHFGDKESLEKYNEYLKKENEEWAAMPMSKSINTTTGEFIGGTAPFMLIPQVKGGLLLRTGYNAIIGGAMGYMDLQDPSKVKKQTRTEKLLWGVAFGAGLSGVMDLKRLPRYLNLRILKQNTTGKAREAYREGDKIVDAVEESTGQRLDFDLYQLTGRPSAGEAVRQYAKTMDGADRIFGQHLSNLEKLGVAWHKIIKKVTKVTTATSPYKLVTGVKTAYDKYMRGLHKIRNGAWEATMGKASVAAKTAEFIDLKHTRKVLGDRLDTLRKGGEPELAGTITRLENTLASLNKNVSVDTLQGKLKLYRELADSSLSTGIEKIKVNTYATIRDALKKEVDIVAATPRPGRPELTEAVGLLKKARDQWSKDSKFIDDTNVSSIGTLLKKDFSEMKVEDVARKLTKMSYREITDIKHIINKVDPAMMDTIRGYTLMDAWRSATKNVNLKGMPNINIKKFWENAPDSTALRALFPEAGARESIEAALKASRKLSESIQGVSGNVVELMQNAAGVAASLSPTFIAILGAKFMGRNYFKQLATSEGRKAIIQMAETTSPSRFIAAAAVLLDTAEDILVIDDLRKQQLREQQQNAPDVIPGGKDLGWGKAL